MITRKCVIQNDGWIPWIQPVLSANGTFGGTSFAASGSGVIADGAPAWAAFDNSTSTRYQILGRSGYIKWYTPVNIKISSITITNYSLRGLKDCIVYGSTDNSNWIQLATYTNTNNTSNAQWSILVNATNAYKYYKLQWSSIIDGLESAIAEIDITATYQP